MLFIMRLIMMERYGMSLLAELFDAEVFQEIIWFQVDMLIQY